MPSYDGTDLGYDGEQCIPILVPNRTSLDVRTHMLSEVALLAEPLIFLWELVDIEGWLQTHKMKRSRAAVTAQKSADAPAS